MQAVILAAGMGKRLKELTENNAKCMVEVNGITLIERALRILDKQKLSKIIIVVGYKGKKLRDYVNSLHITTPIIYVDNKIYNKSNNIYSLLLTKKYLIQEDTLLLESDIIFEENVIEVILKDPRKTLALVDKFASWMDGTCMEIDSDDSIREFIPGKYLKFEEKENYYKTVNIYKFSKTFSEKVYIPFLEAYFKAMGINEYYESVIKLISMLENSEIKVKRLEGQIWYEIDDAQDLDIASTLFPNSKENGYKAICSRYGGFWRYPKLMDYCYLVNPYFPPAKMLEELKSNFNSLLTQYPSGMKVNSSLASKNFNVKQEHIAVGNGAAELIKELIDTMDGKMGIISPTFEEYHNRFKGDIVSFTSDKSDFSYCVEDVMEFFEHKPVEQLVLINPDNPSGNFIAKDKVIELIKWCRNKSIKLIVDESFVDFADDNENLDFTLIDESIIELYEELYVVKSISKSYGVPGLRLGILVSSNINVIDNIKKRLPIWNINSFAEFYMQIYEKYKQDYVRSLIKIREARCEFVEKLKSIEFLEVFPSQANYVMCEIKDGYKNDLITSWLLGDNILVKDLTDKLGNGKGYLRFAIRTKEENDRLIECLKAMRK